MSHIGARLACAVNRDDGTPRMNRAFHYLKVPTCIPSGFANLLGCKGHLTGWCCGWCRLWLWLLWRLCQLWFCHVCGFVIFVAVMFVVVVAIVIVVVLVVLVVVAVCGCHGCRSGCGGCNWGCALRPNALPHVQTILIPCVFTHQPFPAGSKYYTTLR